MNDVERELRDMFTRRENDPADPALATPDRLVRRTRMRQALIVATSLLTVLVVAVGSLVAIRAVTESEGDTDTVPADVSVVLPEAPAGFDSAVLPRASIAYPEGWTVLVFEGEQDVLQLTNFEPEFGRSCFVPEGVPLPPLGAILLIERMPGSVDPSDPMWPVALTEPSPGAPDCRGTQEGDFGAPEKFQATWRTASATLVATAAIGGEAPPDVRRLLFESFASLDVVQGDEPQTEDLLGEANVILDAMNTPVGPVLLYGYADDFESGSASIGIAGVAGSGHAGAGQLGRDPPMFDENVTMNLEPWGGVVWGDVSAQVTRAELRTVEGATFPATLIPLPSDLDGVGHQAVWGIIEGATADRVTTLLYDARGMVLNDYYPAGPRVTIATGEDPEGGPWELYLEPTSDGTGLGFTFTIGGGGSGCCLQPLEGDFELDGWGFGSGEPGHITAFASEAVTRVVFEAANGPVIEGELYPVPDEALGIPQVALVIVPSDVPLEGDLVAFDDSGNELGRELITQDQGEPPGPTPEIDEVWTLLRSARDAISRWAGTHGNSLEGFSLEAAQEAFPEIAWNASGQGKPVPHAVSIRGLAPAGGDELTGWSGWTLTIVGTTPPPPFNTYCIAVNIDENGGGNFRYGIQDALNRSDCRGGWPELG